MKKLHSTSIRIAIFALIATLLLPFTAHSAQAAQIIPTKTIIEPLYIPVANQRIDFMVLIDTGGSKMPLLGNACLFFFIKGVLPVPMCKSFGVSQGAVLFSVKGVPAGTYMVKADYLNDPFYQNSEATLLVNVEPATTTTAINDGVCPALVSKSQQPVLSVTVRPELRSMGQPSGQIDLYEGGVLIASGKLYPRSGDQPYSVAWFTAQEHLSAPRVNMSTLPLRIGTHILTATFTPDNSNFVASKSAPCEVDVTA